MPFNLLNTSLNLTTNDFIPCKMQMPMAHLAIIQIDKNYI